MYTHTHTWALWPCTAFPQLLYAPYKPCHPPPCQPLFSSQPPETRVVRTHAAPCPLPHASPPHDQENLSPAIPGHPAKSSGMLRAGWPGVSNESAPPTRTRPCALRSAHGDLTLSWVETNFPGPSEKERDRAEQPGQPLGHPHGCTQGRGSRLGGRPGAAGSPRSAALLCALAVLRGVSAASGAPWTAPLPASPCHRPPLPAPLPHRAQPAWLLQARAPRSRATLGSAGCRAQREPSQSSGARGAVESPPPESDRPISERRGGSASRAAPAPRSPARGRAHWDLPACSCGSPGPVRPHAR